MEKQPPIVPKCEICGLDAITFVVDIGRLENFRTGLVEFEPFGTTHCFCKKHTRGSNMYDITPFPGWWR